tara:strand:- start:76749 stop:77762 length:1014 start_codon:yes stop_codon:yes gene_type:complete
MSAYLGFIQQALFFGFVISMLLALLSHWLYPRLQNKLRNLSPAGQSGIVFLWSLFPLLAALFIVVIALLPSLLEVLGISSDHCLGHPEGHLHFCLVHLHPAVNSLFIWIPALAYLGMLLLASLNILVDICETLRFKSRLDRFQPEAVEKGIFLLNSDTPMALSIGLWRPQIYLSSGLTDRLRQDEKEFVIRHERAHGQRRDALKKLLARSLSFAHFPATRRKLLSHLLLANEQACDAQSLRNRQDKGRLAELLIKIEKLYRGHFYSAGTLASAINSPGNNVLAERVHHLLDDETTQATRLPLLLFSISILSIGMLISHELIHNELEHLMSLLATVIL